MTSYDNFSQQHKQTKIAILEKLLGLPPTTGRNSQHNATIFIDSYCELTTTPNSCCQTPILDDKIEELQSTIENLNSRIAAKDKAIQELTDKIEDLTTQLNNSYISLDYAKNRQEEAERNLDYYTKCNPEAVAAAAKAEKLLDF